MTSRLLVQLTILMAIAAAPCPAADSSAGALRGSASRELAVEKRYLNLPVKNGSPKKRVSLSVEGRTVREFEIELAEGSPDFWVFLDLESFHGKRAVLKAGQLPENSAGFSAIEQSDSIRGAENLYREPQRPQFHFSSRRGWNNDPNGLVFYKGQYHLFYQHNPYGWDWGNMHWGHAISADLVHWKEMPIALYPYRFGDWAFSGSAAVDWRNTGGFKSGRDDVLVIAYTSTGRGECIVYSNDRGRTWTEYEGNPVVKHAGRDPRLLWHEPSGRWVMAVYDEFEKGRFIAFYTSSDLKAWTFQSRIEGFFECPDLFELPVIGTRGQRKWVLTAASSEYRVGNFDGRTFIPETGMLPGHRGNAFYAAQTYSDIPRRDGRRIQIGWGRIATPGMPFNQMMCFPTVMTLRQTEAGPRLAWQPANEIRKLREKTRSWRNERVAPDKERSFDSPSDLLQVEVQIEPGEAKRITLTVRGVPLTYDVQKGELSCLDRKGPLSPQDGKVSLNLLADRTSLEVFGQGGLLYMPMAWKPAADDHSVAVRADGGEAKLSSLRIHQLRSSWR